MSEHTKSNRGFACRRRVGTAPELALAIALTIAGLSSSHVVRYSVAAEVTPDLAVKQETVRSIAGSSSASRFPTLVTPAPVQFFTIAEITAKRAEPVRYEAPVNSRGVEPFGAVLRLASNGQLWTKWQKVIADIRAQEPKLERCLAYSSQCPAAAARFGAIVNDARKLRGRDKVLLVNRRINAAIRYKADAVQWGSADVWSAPLDSGNKGSFDTGFGDCEDYAIAKYVALREADVPALDLRLLVGRDRMARLDHAVLAVRDGGQWLILDNRWDGLAEDTDSRRFEPLFALDDQGTKLVTFPPSARVSSLH